MYVWKVHKRKSIVLVHQYFLLCHTASNLRLTSTTDGGNGHGDYGHGSGGSYGSYTEKSNFICKSMVYLQRTKMIFYSVFITNFCFTVLYDPLLTSEVIYYGRAGCLWMTEEMEKGTLSQFQSTFPEGQEKTTQTHTRLSVNVIHWHRNSEYLTSLWSTAISTFVYSTLTIAK